MEELSNGGVVQKWSQDLLHVKLYHHTKFQLSSFKTIIMHKEQTYIHTHTRRHTHTYTHIYIYIYTYTLIYR